MTDEMSTEYRRAVEALILVADTPVPPTVLAQLIEIPEQRVI